MLDIKILELFPYFNEIKKEELKELGIKAMYMAIKEGGWSENIQEVPVTINWENVNCNLINHINLVTKLCLKIYDSLSDLNNFNGMKMDRDIVILGALLHDIGKFIEFEYVEGKVKYSEKSKYMRHPLIGAILVKEIGLPDEVINIVANHSFEGDRSFIIPEGHLIKNVDNLVFENTVLGLNKKSKE